MPTATSANSTLVLDIQVSGHRSYSGDQWREAILAYLHGVWSGDPSVCSRQKLHFNNTTIRLSGGGKYYAYFVDEPNGGSFADIHTCSDDTLMVIEDEHDVESGLIRFVRNNKIRHLCVLFEDGAMIALSKGQKRSQLFIATSMLPSMKDVMRSAGYNV